MKDNDGQTTPYLRRQYRHENKTQCMFLIGPWVRTDNYFMYKRNYCKKCKVSIICEYIIVFFIKIYKLINCLD